VKKYYRFITFIKYFCLNIIWIKLIDIALHKRVAYLYPRVGKFNPNCILTNQSRELISGGCLQTSNRLLKPSDIYIFEISKPTDKTWNLKNPKNCKNKIASVSQFSVEDNH